MKEANRTLFSE